jgi:hypothetical protein
MKTIWTLLLGLTLLPLCAQSDFSGAWKGILTQDDGGFRSEYQFEVYLIQEGKEVRGRTYVSVDDIYAELDIEGQVVNGNTVLFREIRFVRFSRLENLEWCYKLARLTLRREGDTWRLEGPWEGYTSFGRCIPGKIFLTREKPQV